MWFASCKLLHIGAVNDGTYGPVTQDISMMDVQEARRRILQRRWTSLRRVPSQNPEHILLGCAYMLLEQCGHAAVSSYNIS